jgi:hypothetical protein
MPFTMRHGMPAAALAAGAVLLSACASSPRPTEELAAADLAVEQAEASLAPTYAPDLVGKARDKRNEAEAAADAEANVRARRLAEQAVVDARLAEATADAEVADESLEEMEASVSALGESPADPAVLLTN